MSLSMIHRPDQFRYLKMTDDMHDTELSYKRNPRGHRMKTSPCLPFCIKSPQGTEGGGGYLRLPPLRSITSVWTGWSVDGDNVLSKYREWWYREVFLFFSSSTLDRDTSSSLFVLAWSLRLRYTNGGFMNAWEYLNKLRDWVDKDLWLDMRPREVELEVDFNRIYIRI